MEVLPLVWDRIAADLEQAIAERRLGPGDKLPSEQQLVRRYYVNRHMVRRALASLAGKGLIVSHQGRGSFVTRPVLPMPITRRTRFTETVRRAGAVHASCTLRLETLPGSAAIAQQLGVRAGTPLVQLERLATVNGQPTGISAHHFVAERVPGFIELYERCGSITVTLRAIGIVDYVRLRTRLHARLPLPEEARLLDMPQHVPLIITNSINADPAGQTLEYGEARLAADRVEIVVVSDETSTVEGNPCA